MENLLQKNDTQTMSSREIAELTGKRHDHVLRDCDVLNENYEKLSLPKIGECDYRADNGQIYREYLLTRMQTFDLMTGYNTELRIKVNRRWEELEKRTPQIDFSDPSTILMLAQNWKEEQEKRIEAEKMAIAERQAKETAEEKVKLQEQEIKQAAPKVEYYDEVLQSESLIATNVIAKDLGMSAVSLNKILHQKGIIYNSAGTWVLYAKYQNRGYTGTKTTTYQDSLGNERTAVHTYWTEKGRRFILSFFNRPVGKYEKRLAKEQMSC